YTHDVSMTALSFAVALHLRVGDTMFRYAPAVLAQNMALLVIVGAVIYRATRLYRGVWRYASLNDLLGITKAVTAVMLVFLPAGFFLTRLEGFPRSLVVINWLVLLAMLGGPRLFYRMVKDGRISLSRKDHSHRIPTLLIGGGDGADLFVRAMQDPKADYHVVGILDDHGPRAGSYIHGVEVLGTYRDIAAVIARLEDQGLRPQRMILTDDDIHGERVRQLVELAD